MTEGGGGEETNVVCSDVKEVDEMRSEVCESGKMGEREEGGGRGERIDTKSQNGDIFGLRDEVR